jgi:thioredoxin 1
MFKKLNVLFLVVFFVFGFLEVSYAGGGCGTGGCSLSQFFKSVGSESEEESKDSKGLDVKDADNPKSKEKETSKPKVTFIELGSERCMPCKMMKPVLKEIKKEYKGKVNVVFYDVWTKAGKPYAEKYKIMSIPTQVFLDENGKEYFRHTGFFPKKEIDKILKKGGVE